jgi:hypothetical protein
MRVTRQIRTARIVSFQAIVNSDRRPCAASAIAYPSDRIRTPRA